jgi:hypothetical protein
MAKIVRCFVVVAKVNDQQTLVCGVVHNVNATSLLSGLIAQNK